MKNRQGLFSLFSMLFSLLLVVADCKTVVAGSKTVVAGSNNSNTALYFIGAMGVLNRSARPATMESTQFFEISNQPASGKRLRTVQITSDLVVGDAYDVIVRQQEVSSKIQSTVNSGHFNIVSVITFYLDGYLTTATVIYDTSPGRGVGYDMRMMLIQSDSLHAEERHHKIKYQLDMVVESEIYDIVKINKVYVQGSLLAAEVYYRKKR